MVKVSTNSFDLIKSAGEKVKGKFLKALLATILSVAPLMLCVFTLYLAPVAVVLFGVFETGYIRYMRELMSGNNPSVKLIFSEFKNPGLEIFLGTILICMFVGGSVLLLVPGIIFIALYSMSLYFAEYNKSKMPFDAMYDCNKYMKGNYINMFSFKSIYWVCYALLIIGGLSGVFGSYKLWTDYKLWSILLFVGTYLVVVVLWSVVTIYYKASSEMFFQELLVYNAKNTVKEEPKKVEIIEEQEKVEEVKKPASSTKKATTKVAPKTSSTKTTVKPSTSKTNAEVKKTTASKTGAGVKKTTTAKSTTPKASTTKKTSTKK